MSRRLTNHFNASYPTAQKTACGVLLTRHLATTCTASVTCRACKNTESYRKQVARLALVRLP